MSPELRGRRAVGDVHDAEHAEQQRAPADHLAAGGAVALGVAQVAPGDEAEQQRDEPREQADRAGDDRAGEVTDAAGQLPPHGGGDHHARAPTRNSPAPSRRCSGSSSLAVWPMRRTPPPTAWATPEPRGHQHPGERGEDTRDRPGPVADGPGCGTLGVRAARLRAAAPRACALSWFPSTGIASVEPPCPSCGQRSSCCATPAGKTYGSPCWRIYPEHLICPLRHTPRGAVSSRRCAGQPAGRCVGATSSTWLVVDVEHAVDDLAMSVAQRQPQPEGAARRRARRPR